MVDGLVARNDEEDVPKGPAAGVRKNKEACSPPGSFNFRDSTSPPLGASMASSISFSALPIHPSVLVGDDASPMKRASTRLSRSFLRSDLRRGASFLPPKVEEPSLWNIVCVSVVARPGRGSQRSKRGEGKTLMANCFLLLNVIIL